VTHTKLVVLDGATSILGSHNWSASGLTRNSESSVLVRSKDVAAVFGRCFADAWSKGNGVTGVVERQRREAEKWQ
jgi:phosphatidylserine/phosphatidylglycerophosphate/cardiolipin synthase-like enzyme